MKLLAIDVGTRNAGIAVWANDVKKIKTRSKLTAGPAPMPTCTEVFVPNARLEFTWERRARAVCDGVQSVMDHWGVGEGWIVAVEWPEFRPGSAVGHAAAAKDSLGQLYFVCGVIAEKAWDWDAEFKRVVVSDWKGQLPKRVCERRIRRALPDLNNNLTNHELDAVGIGLYALGHGHHVLGRL